MDTDFAAFALLLGNNLHLESPRSELETRNRQLEDEIESLRLWCQSCESRADDGDKQRQENEQLKKKVRELREELTSTKVAWELEKSEIQSHNEGIEVDRQALQIENERLAADYDSIHAACQVLLQEGGAQPYVLHPSPHPRPVVTDAPKASSDDIEVVQDAICCTICTRVLKDPVIGSCCQSILGCRDCVLRSMQASGDKCPMCRGDHPQITVVKGLGEMYQALGRMFPTDES